jgi:hypothetical protein
MQIEVLARRGTPREWEAADPILRAGEMGLELSGATASMKVGNGSTPWTDLPYTATGFGLPGGEPLKIFIDTDGRAIWESA